MIHILSQEGTRLINAEKVGAYLIETAQGRYPTAGSNIIARLADTNCKMAYYQNEYTAIKVLRMLSDEISKNVSGNMLFIFPNEKTARYLRDVDD